MNLDTLLLYSVISFFYVLSPGPAVFLAITNGILYDMRVVLASSLGNILGLFTLSAVSISGLGAILISSATLFMIVKLIGACYLIYLGIKQFRNASSFRLENIDENKIRNKSLSRLFSESYFLAATNPKPIIFFIALFPQFLDLEKTIFPQFLIMTGIFMFFSFFILAIYGFLSKTSKKWFKNHNNLKWFHRITGGIFIGLGLSLTQLKTLQN